MVKSKHAGLWTLDDILQAACQVARARIDDVRAQKERHGRLAFRYKRRDVAFARELYAAFGHEVAGYSWPWLAAHLNCHHSTLLLAGRRALAHRAWPQLRDTILDLFDAPGAAETETMACPMTSVTS